MISAANIQYFTTLSPKHLNAIGYSSGYKDVKIRSAEFLGLTNGGEFCYSATFYDDVQDEEITAKVFVSYDPASDRASLDF